MGSLFCLVAGGDFQTARPLQPVTNAAVITSAQRWVVQPLVPGLRPGVDRL